MSRAIAATAPRSSRHRRRRCSVRSLSGRRAATASTWSSSGAGPVRVDVPGVRDLGMLTRDELPALYASADALVLPSVRTATFREPWGLVVNEAMQQATPVIVSDEVGAAAGGLVVDGRNGLVVPAGDADALAGRIRALAMNPDMRERLGEAARDDVSAFSEEAWVEGM